jgi:hypothetical protein
MSSNLAGHMAILGILRISDSLTRRRVRYFRYPGLVYASEFPDDLPLQAPH